MWLEKCTKGGNGDIKVRATKEIRREHSAGIDYNRELEAIAKFSQPKVWLHHQSLIARFIDIMKYDRCFVKSFGWYESPEYLFIAMEYLKLGDLKIYLDGKPPLQEFEAREIMYQIVDGLRFMHGNQFAHRDLKPKASLFFVLLTSLRESFLTLYFEK